MEMKSTKSQLPNALEGFPFHKYCGFCRNECQQIKVDSDYLLITNIWNEHDNIPKTFHRVSAQSKKPKVWLWIDDGSTDGSGDVIRNCASLLPDVDIWIESMPLKSKGNLDTIGRAFDRILPQLKDKVNRIGISYIGIMDVDTNPCPNYFARLLWLLERHPKIGAAAGILLGEVGKRRVGLPMGTGKLIRWSIVQKIDKYWDIAPDTLFNIKAMSFGYSVRTFPIPTRIDRLTKAFTKSGAFRQGRLSYYVGRPFWAVLFRSARRLLILQFGSEMLRGYFYERRRGTWRFDDPDIARFYGKGGNPITALLEMSSYVGMHE
jgi:hypothetical protein